MKRSVIALVLLLSVACGKNVDIQRKAEATGNDFVVERIANISGLQTIFVVRDKVNGKLLYITPGAGVWVEKN
jgi:hypothetical protein